MSRHEFEHDGARWIVGWDEPTVTFYAQHEGTDRELTDVAGTSVGQHTTVVSLLEQLRVDELAGDLQRAARGPQPTAEVER